MKVTIIGTGFVGVVSAAVFSSLGNTVVGLDIDEKKIKLLQQSKVPFYEPQLETLLIEEQKKGRLSFSQSYEVAVRDADVVIIAVGTPSAADGNADLQYVYAAAQSAAPFLKDSAVLVIKSTVPPGTLTEIKKIVSAHTNKVVHFAAVPEFLREGVAVQDTLSPDRIVIGAEDAFAFSVLDALHQPLKAPMLHMSPESAQMTKYAANAYLATRITFINQISDLCEKNGADIEEVIKGISEDKRIGAHYWYPGLGYGGSCFPKDVNEIAFYSRQVGLGNNLFNALTELNTNRIPTKLLEYGEKIGGWKDKRVAVLGIAFKPNTDDTREAPSIRAIPYLLEHGATVHAYDPKAIYSHPEWSKQTEFTQHDTLEDALADAEVILLLVEWPEFETIDFSKYRNAQKSQWIIDTRNRLKSDQLKELGFSYIGMGHE